MNPFELIKRLLLQPGPSRTRSSLLPIDAAVHWEKTVDSLTLLNFRFRGEPHAVR
jgi:hypothetical protein